MAYNFPSSHRSSSNSSSVIQDSASDTFDSYSVGEDEPPTQLAPIDPMRIPVGPFKLPSLETVLSYDHSSPMQSPTLSSSYSWGSVELETPHSEAASPSPTIAWLEEISVKVEDTSPLLQELPRGAEGIDESRKREREFSEPDERMAKLVKCEPLDESTR